MVTAAPSFHELADWAFRAALPALLQEGRRLAEETRAPCIVAVQSAAQQTLAMRLAAGSAQVAPKDDARPAAQLVILVASSSRGRNFGRFCNSMVHLPLMQGVPARRQLHGCLHRGPRRPLIYRVVVPTGTVLHFLARAHALDERADVSLKDFVAQALEIEKQRARTLPAEAGND